MSPKPIIFTPRPELVEWVREFVAAVDEGLCRWAAAYEANLEQARREQRQQSGRSWEAE